LQGIQRDPERKLERWFYTDWLQSSWFQAMARKRGQREEALGEDSSGTLIQGVDESSESDLPSDFPSGNLLQPSFATPNPRFWSLDNPLVATAILISMVILLSLTIS